MKANLTLFCFGVFATSVCSQTQLYQQAFSYYDIDKEEIHSSIAISGNIVVFSASDFHLHAVNKTSHKTIWNNPVDIQSNLPAYFYKGTFLFPTQ